MGIRFSVPLKISIHQKANRKEEIMGDYGRDYYKNIDRMAARSWSKERVEIQIRELQRMISQTERYIRDQINVIDRNPRVPRHTEDIWINFLNKLSDKKDRIQSDIDYLMDFL